MTSPISELMPSAVIGRGSCAYIDGNAGGNGNVIINFGFISRRLLTGEGVSEKLNALLVVAAALINFNFCGVNCVRDEQLVSRAGMQSNRAAAVDDVHGAARSDINAGFLARIGGVGRCRRTNAEACGSNSRARVAVLDFMAVLLPPHPFRVTNGRSPSGTPFLFARTHSATALARMRHWGRSWQPAQRPRYKRSRRAGWLHRRAALPATAAKAG